MSNFRIFLVNRICICYGSKFIVSAFKKYFDTKFSEKLCSKALFIRNLNLNMKLKYSLKYSGLSLGFFPFFFKKESDSGVPENLLARAVYAIQENKLPEAFEYLTRILTKLATQFTNEEITAIEYESKKARIYSEMANIYLLVHNLDKASETIIETMKNCFAAGIGPSHPIIIELSLKLSLIYAEQEKYSDANIGFKFTIENCQNEMNKMELDEEEVKNLEALLGMCYNYYSKFLYQIGKYPLALESATKALELALKIYGKNHRNVVNLINDQAVIHLALGNHYLAQTKFQEAIDICLACPEDEVVELLPHIYVNFGRSYIDIGDPMKAEEMCGNSKKYWKDLSKESESYKELKSQIDDCFIKLAGLKSIDRED